MTPRAYIHVSELLNFHEMRMTHLKTFTIVMYPWFAMGHLTAFLHLSNKIAARGHRIFFFLPMRTQTKLEQFNLYPDLIKFEPIIVPQLQGLPPGTETTLDIPFPLQPLLRQAMDLTRPNITSFLREIKPHFVFFDFSHWMPSVTRPLGIRSINLFTISPATVAYVLREGETTHADLMIPPSGFPSPGIRLRTHEARGLNLAANSKDPDDSLTFMQRLIISVVDCDAIAFRACREMEGSYCEFLENKFNKPIILAGPVVPETSPTTSTQEQKWRNWLNSFKPKSVVYCAFGSECRLQKDQFQELLLGLELTGLPFFVALKSPIGVSPIEDALPEGFKARTQGKGIVHDGWVPQTQILAHPSVGFFLTHCGSGSLCEALVSECQMVLLPNHGDQVINARVVMGGDLKVGVEVEKGDEDGLFTKQGVYRAIKMAIDDEEDSEIGKEIRANHSKWREFLLNRDLESQYMHDFLHKLKELLKH